MIQDTSAQDRVIQKGKGLSRGALLRLMVIAIVVLSIFFLLSPAIRRWSVAERSFDRSRFNYAKVDRGTIVRDIGVEGRIVASSYPTIFSPADGAITLKIKPGTVVEEGQVLGVVKSPQLENRLKQERAQLDALDSELSRQRITAKTNYLSNEQDIDLKKLRHEAAKRAFERAKLTFGRGLINAAEYEEAQDQVAITELEHRHARGKAGLDREVMAFEIRNKGHRLGRQRLVLEDVERRVAELTLRSPVNGVIGTVNVDPRDYVSTNQALLTVIDLSAFEIQVSIPEAYADEIQPGIPAEITYESRVFPGMVASVAPEVNDSLVTGSVVFTGALPEGLRQNQRVSTRVILSRHENTLKVRRGPFLESGGGRIAYVVRDGLASKAEIQTGATSMTEVEILAGLDPGDDIIISDISLFENAQTILLRK